ncbi:hypothetical protein AtNW77_Chr1g0042721 [Arabidopsis thaliana]
MGAAKTMFHKRFMCNPLKYSNHRIAFLDQDLIRKMEKDYKHFSSDSKTYKWTDYYANHQNVLRIKLGAEMFDELREFAGTLNFEICRKEFELPRLNDS